MKAMQVSEQSVRRLAKREGYVLKKSRVRSPSDPSYGGYMLVEPERNFVVFGIGLYPYSADLEEIRTWLQE
jgi:hypothetical protein